MWKLIAAMCKTKTTEPELIVQLRLFWYVHLTLEERIVILLVAIK